MESLVPFNNLIDRGANAAVLQAGDIGALIPEDVSSEIMEGVAEKSAALQLFRHKSMGRAQTRIPVLSALPTAYFVNGDTGQKQTTDMSWVNVYLNAEEIAAIIPIPEKVLDDTSYDLWAEIKPWMEEAIAVALDDAIFFGTNKPTNWPASIVAGALAAGNNVITTSALDVLGDLNQAMAAVEADGYLPNGYFARIQMRARLRGLRDTTRNFLLEPDEVTPVDSPLRISTLWGEKIVYSRAGFAAFATAAGNYSAITGDFNQGIIGIRQDITYKMLDQAVLTDGAGAIIYNLPQQDMVAMRVVARFAFAVPNPVNRLQPLLANRYPFGYVQQLAATGGESILGL